MRAPAYTPRKFLPESIDLADISALGPWMDRLEEELQKAETVSDLEQWLDRAGEFFAACDDEGSRRYVAMTCQTDDPDREKAYLQLIEVVEPWMKPKRFSLWRRLTSHPAFSQLSSEYQVFRRSAQTEVMLYREANIARETESAKLSQVYQKTMGAMTVQFEGEEKTLTQLSPIQEEPDRPRRQAAWEASVHRRLQDADAIDTTFEQLIQLRESIAQEAGFTDFRAYSFEAKERFDYTPEDCLTFHQTIETTFVPLTRSLQQQRKETLSVDSLRPWDLGVDPLNRPPLRPFKTATEFVDKTSRTLHRLDPRLGRLFDDMKERELLDLENRKGKAPGGYQASLSEARLPFIFMNAVGMENDVKTLLHEAGHAFHTYQARDQRLYWYRWAPIEFCEVASMAMELLAAPYLTEFYTEGERLRSQKDHLEGIIKFFPWMAIIDAFQHQIYTHPHQSRDERDQAWNVLMNRFGGLEEWSGYEKVRSKLWHRQSHLFTSPFYYVEYGIAQLGALQLWRIFQEDQSRAIECYLHGLSLGGSKPLPDLFRETGIAFDFSEKTIQPLIDLLQKTIQQSGE
ncbi:MAG: M3 family oligoendopeptidase [Verrucomicrobiota bacterium]